MALIKFTPVHVLKGPGLGPVKSTAPPASKAAAPTTSAPLRIPFNKLGTGDTRPDTSGNFPTIHYNIPLYQDLPGVANDPLTSGIINVLKGGLGSHPGAPAFAPQPGDLNAPFAGSAAGVAAGIAGTPVNTVTTTSPTKTTKPTPKKPKPPKKPVPPPSGGNKPPPGSSTTTADTAPAVIKPPATGAKGPPGMPDTSAGYQPTDTTTGTTQPYGGLTAQQLVQLVNHYTAGVANAGNVTPAVLDTLSKQAVAQALATTNPQIVGAQGQRSQYVTEAANRAAAVMAAYRAMANMSQGDAANIQNAYRTAGSDMAAAGAGFTGAMQAADARQMNANQAQLGQATTPQGAAQALGPVAGGANALNMMQGTIPANEFAREAARDYSAALAAPKGIMGSGIQAMQLAQHASDAQVQKINDYINQVRATLPGITQKALAGLVNNYEASGKLAIDKARLAATTALGFGNLGIAQGHLGVDQGRLSLSQQDQNFNHWLQTNRLNLDSQAQSFSQWMDVYKTNFNDWIAQNKQNFDQWQGKQTVQQAADKMNFDQWAAIAGINQADYRAMTARMNAINTQYHYNHPATAMPKPLTKTQIWGIVEQVAIGEEKPTTSLGKPATQVTRPAMNDPGGAINYVMLHTGMTLPQAISALSTYNGLRSQGHGGATGPYNFTAWWDYHQRHQQAASVPQAAGITSTVGSS